MATIKLTDGGILLYVETFLPIDFADRYFAELRDSLVSMPHVAHRVDGSLTVALGRGSASIIFVFNGIRSMRREPRIDFRFPAVMQVVSGLEAAGGILDVLEGPILLPTSVI
jgi:hypothetical protein